jgi:hypothetical protein
MENQPWLFTLLVMSGPAAFGAILPVVEGKESDPKLIRRAYVLAAIYSLGLGTVVSVAINSPDPLVASFVIVLASITVNEWAIALRGVEKARDDNGPSV